MSGEQMNEVLDDTDLFERLAAAEPEGGGAPSLDVAAFFEKLNVVREPQASFEIAPSHRSTVLHIELEGEVIGEHLVLTAPPGTPLPFTLEGNTIILGDYHISVRWKGVRDSAS